MLPVFNPVFILIATWAWPNSVENTESSFTDNSKQDRCNYKKKNTTKGLRQNLLYCTTCITNFEGILGFSVQSIILVKAETNKQIEIHQSWITNHDILNSCK